MANTAFQQVFQTFELARLILEHLHTGRDLINARRSCRDIGDHVQVMMDELTPGHRDALSAVAPNATPNIRLNHFLDLAIPWDDRTPDDGKFGMFWFTSTALYGWSKADAPWNMFLTHPPVKRVVLSLHGLLPTGQHYLDYLGRDNTLVHHTRTSHLRKDDGVTLGDVIARLLKVCHEDIEDLEGIIVMVLFTNRGRENLIQTANRVFQQSVNAYQNELVEDDEELDLDDRFFALNGFI